MAVFVLADHLVSQIQYGFAASIVLLQPYGLHRGIIPLKLEDIAQTGAAEAIDRLIIIAHHAYSLMLFGEMMDDLKLRLVCILILIDHDILKDVLILPPQLFFLAQKLSRIE